MVQRETHFWDRGCQYYIADRFAVAGGLNPVSGNLLHHAVEFLLKGALSKTRTLGQMRQYMHKLPPLWTVFKTEIADASLARFDSAITALHSYEDLRYPDDALKNGMESMITSHRVQARTQHPPVPDILPADVAAELKQRLATLPRVKRYELCLQDVDDLVAAIFNGARRNPRFFFNGRNPKALEALVEGNLAAALLK